MSDQATPWYFLGEMGVHCSQAHFVGSRVTCNPPPTNTDIDILVRVESLAMFTRELLGVGYAGGGSFDESKRGSLDFASFKKGEVNIIATDSDEFIKRFLSASHFAKRFNIMEKKDRISLFQAVLYGNIA